MAKAIMIQGTCSNAGKSLFAAALCRVFREDGYRVAPFKSQNMALNSAVTPDGLEIGRAQAMQAEAAGIAPDVRMNPILLKPNSDTGSQLVLCGKPVGDYSAIEYQKKKKGLLSEVLKAYHSLAAEQDIMVIEGAGSPAEINLRADDIVNMGLAEAVDAPVILIGDIDRGGVFAALYGTVKLLSEAEQARIKGLVINKFRGDIKILEPGLRQIEALTEKPVLGVLPYRHFDLEDEDSLSERLRKTKAEAEALLRIAVIRLPRLSNFTDFDPLQAAPEVALSYVNSPAEIGAADLLILPGSKSTLEDLAWLKAQGFDTCIRDFAASGRPVLGICGGYQMLGETLRDKESGVEAVGLGLLPVDTVFYAAKQTVCASGTITAASGFWAALAGQKTEGYEIHMGQSRIGKEADCFQRLSAREDSERQRADGCVAGAVCGSYLHGLFDEVGVTEALLHALAARKGLSYSHRLKSRRERQEAGFRLLSQMLREHFDLRELYRIMGVER